MYKGKIVLKRKTTCFEGGFCLVNKDLKDLIEEIGVLHSEELKYYQTLKFSRRKQSYLLGRIAAKNAISILLKSEEDIRLVSIKSGVFQFPIVKNIQYENIQVSISHCDNYGIVLAFPEEHPLGVDIEKIDKNKADTMKSVISGKEKELIEKSSFLRTEVEAVTIMWTVKEALSKILKTGLTANFEIFEIDSIQKKDSIYISTFKHFSQYKSISYPAYNYLCSIVLPKNTSVNLEGVWSAFRMCVLKSCSNKTII